MGLRDRLQQVPEWLFYTYIGLVAVFLIISLWFIVRLLLPSSAHKKEKLTEQLLVEELESDILLYECSLRDAV